MNSLRQWNQSFYKINSNTENWRRYSKMTMSAAHLQNASNFLMRFLKFIALFLHKYAPNADVDVKGMFETAYSSLLEDDPDSKKKRKEESLKKHRNLLQSVPSNEEFKSLLGNPKNIKDCGISVTESLTILTDRWDKLSGLEKQGLLLQVLEIQRFLLQVLEIQWLLQIREIQ